LSNHFTHKRDTTRDRSGTHLAGDHILQHERLSIVDPMGGAQPIKNDKGTCVLRGDVV
jgi:asparagine synthetase B (glutamine-hydrolysing)